MNMIKRSIQGVGLGFTAVLLMAVPAFAVDATPAELATQGASGLKTEFFLVLAAIIPVYLTVLAAKKGLTMGIRWINRVFH
jgi:hypothetical protein